MAKINPGTLHDYKNGEVVIEQYLDTDHEIIRTAINDNFDRTQNHKNASILDHPDGSVTTQKLASGAVTSDKIASGAITSTQIGPNTISTDKIQDASVTTSKIADRNVTGGKIAVRTIISDNIADGAVRNSHIVNGALDDRYYTKNQLDSNVYDHKGTWRGMTPEFLGDPILSQRITKLENTISNADSQKTVLRHGYNVLSNTAKDALVSMLHTAGRTLVNLLGNHGNCEVLSGWNAWQSTLSLDSTHKLYGSYGLKSSVAFGVDAAVYREVPVTAGKYYIALVDAKNGNADSAVLVFDRYQSQVTSDTTRFSTLYMKLQPSNTGLVNFDMHISGSVGKYAYFDGGRVYSIPKDIYDKIDIDPEYTGQKLAEKFPYVDNMKSLQGTYFKKHGKNLAPPFREWKDNDDTLYRITDPYTMAVDSTTYNALIAIAEIPALPSTTYTFSFDVSTAGLHLSILFLNNGEWESEGSVHQSSPTLTLQTYASTTAIKLHFNTNNVGQPFTIRNVQVEMSVNRTPFEPKDDDHLFYPGTLASSADGKLYDFLYQDGADWFKHKNFEQKVLDGSLPWFYSSGIAGWRTIHWQHGFTTKHVVVGCVKFNGIPLHVNEGSFTGADNISAMWADGKMFISVADLDAGWGANFNPSDAEVKAYFYGWKMYPSDTDSTGTALYPGTGTKAWIARRADGSLDTGRVTNVVPTTLVPGFNPYRLQYQLATPITEAVQVEGALSLHEGNNLVEVGTGVIVRERVVPFKNTSDGNYYINHATAGYFDANSQLKNKTNHVFAIYKNGQLDSSWNIGRDISGTNGGFRGKNAIANVDPTATYTVTYLMLDKNLYTTNVTDATIEYGGSFKTVQDDLVQRMTNVEGKVTVNTNTIIDIIVRLKAGGL